MTHTGYNNSFFRASFPFSWIIKEQVDSLLSNDFIATGDFSSQTIDLFFSGDFFKVWCLSVLRHNKLTVTLIRLHFGFGGNYEIRT